MKMEGDDFALEIALGNLNLCRIVDDFGSSDEDSMTYTNSQVIDEDQALLRKLSFVAHNLKELKKIFANFDIDAGYYGIKHAKKEV